MGSLAAAKEFVKDDFLLLEGDTFYERKVLEQLAATKHPVCFSITEETGSGDECYVEIKSGFVRKLTKDRHRVCNIEGEMIGATKVSLQAYKAMVGLYDDSTNPLLSCSKGLHMATTDKLLTISVAAYNVADFIEETLASLLVRDLDQIEVLVVDRGLPRSQLRAASTGQWFRGYGRAFL